MYSAFLSVVPRVFKFVWLLVGLCRKLCIVFVNIFLHCIYCLFLSGMILVSDNVNKQLHTVYMRLYLIRILINNGSEISVAFTVDFHNDPNCKIVIIIMIQYVTENQMERMDVTRVESPSTLSIIVTRTQKLGITRVSGTVGRLPLTLLLLLLLVVAGDKTVPDP